MVLINSKISTLKISVTNICRFRYFADFYTTLSGSIFACIYFWEPKKLYFVSTYFCECQVFENSASTYFCEWQVYENFEFINLAPKKKEQEKDSWIKGHSANVSVKINGKTKVVDWF